MSYIERGAALSPEAAGRIPRPSTFSMSIQASSDIHMILGKSPRRRLRDGNDTAIAWSGKRTLTLA
jgi:hypothetical protein